MVPFSTFHSGCLSAFFQLVRSLPLKSEVNPAGGCLTPSFSPALAPTTTEPAMRRGNNIRFMRDSLWMEKQGGWGHRIKFQNSVIKIFLVPTLRVGTHC